MEPGIEGADELILLVRRRSLVDALERAVALVSPARLFVLVGGLTMATLVLLTPPFQTPDEQQHFFRAFAISDGLLLPEARNGLSGATVPVSLTESAAHFLGNRHLHPAPGHRTTAVGDTLRQLQTPLDADRRAFVEISAFYLPTAYAPQVAGIWVGRLFHLGPVGLLLAARAANALVALLLIRAALQIIPTAAAQPVLWIALLPCSQIEFASCSADASVISTSLFFSALLIRELSGKSWNLRLGALAFSCSTIFAAAKMAYIPLSVVGAVRAGRRRFHVFLGLSTALIVVVWLRLTPNRYVARMPGVDSSDQLAGIIAHPLGFGHAIWAGVLQNWIDLWLGFIGELGWNSYILPIWVYALLPFAGAFSLFAKHDAIQMPKASTAWAVVLSLSCVILFAGALYLTWTPVGAAAVTGLQGRYFIPLAAITLPVMSAQLARLQLTTIEILAAPIVALAGTASSVTLVASTITDFGLFN